MEIKTILAFLTALAAAVSFFLLGYSRGYKRTKDEQEKKPPDQEPNFPRTNGALGISSGEWRERIRELWDPVKKVREHLKEIDFPGIKQAERQLWYVLQELERLELWLRFYTSGEEEKEKVLTRLESVVPLKMDIVFLEYIIKSEALFEFRLRRRCSQMLEKRKRA